MYELKYYLLFLLLSLLVPFISCSDGDRSPFYQKCLQKCKNANCTSDGAFSHEAAALQDPWDWLLRWGCEDECRYHCMWRTVEGYRQRGYQIPKFHGKWPFKRNLGLQEPASVVASALNLLSHLRMQRKILLEFPLGTPMIVFWHCFICVSMHGWMWSAVFHARDTPFTEFMDYACALSMVMSLLVAAIVRILHGRWRALRMVLVGLLALYYVEHVRYLYTGRIDYDYNMKVNVLFGAAGSALWLAWAWRQLLAGRRYAWRVVAFTVGSAAALEMELWDFPPHRGWDAHAMWHLFTAPLPLIFYRFVIDDLRYLQQSSVKSDLKLP